MVRRIALRRDNMQNNINYLLFFFLFVWEDCCWVFSFLNPKFPLFSTYILMDERIDLIINCCQRKQNCYVEVEPWEYLL